MKQVILSEQDKITVNEINEINFHGVESHDFRTFVIYDKNKGSFYAVDPLLCIEHSFPSLEDLITTFLKRKMNVYEFETRQELFKWLSE